MLVLLNDDGIRLAKLSLHSLNDRLDQLVLFLIDLLFGVVAAKLGETLLGNLPDGSLELDVLLYSACEDFDGHFLVQRGTDDLEETVELFLLVLGTLRRDQVQAHLILRILRQVHVFHGRVRHVDLLLKSGLFLADLANEHGHLSENDSVVQNQRYQDDENERDLIGCPWAHFISTESEDGHVENDHVLVPLGDLFEIVEAVITLALHVDEVERWDPLLLNLHDQVPEAANDVHDEEQGQNQLEDLHHSFLVLLQLQLLDNL